MNLYKVKGLHRNKLTDYTSLSTYYIVASDVEQATASARELPLVRIDSIELQVQNVVVGE